jgi:hypothetical protein
MTWCGMESEGKERHDISTEDNTRKCKARHGKARHDMRRKGMA